MSAHVLGKLGLAVWLPAILVPGALLMASHLLTLPTPPSHDVQDAIHSSRLVGERGHWLALHVLYGKCACSQRVLDHLVSRGARHDVAERVLLVDGGPTLEDRLVGAGYAVERLSALDLRDRYHIESVPLLVVASPADEVRYIGGYTSRKQGPDVRDVAIIDDAIRGSSDPSLPLFGCAVSKNLQKTLDPLGLKY
jgi:hypothetical protein